MKFNRIIIALRKTIEQNYEEMDSENITDENGVLILTRELSSRVANNWGRDRDTDENIYLNKNGWISLTTVGEYGAGPAKIISENRKKVNDEYVYNIFNKDDEISLHEFLHFIDRFYKIKEEYSNKFTNNLY